MTLFDDKSQVEVSNFTNPPFVNEAIDMIMSILTRPQRHGELTFDQCRSFVYGYGSDAHTFGKFTFTRLRTVPAFDFDGRMKSENLKVVEVTAEGSDETGLIGIVVSMDSWTGYDLERIDPLVPARYTFDNYVFDDMEDSER